MEQRPCRITRLALQFLQSTKLYVSNSNLFWHVVEGSGRAPQISGRLWLVREGFGKLWGRFWTVLGVSAKLWKALDGHWQGFGQLWMGLCMQPWNGSGRLWTAFTGSKEVWTVLEGSGRLWEASNSSRELIRSLRDVRNHAPTVAGKHILLNRCFASPKRARWRK